MATLPGFMFSAVMSVFSKDSTERFTGCTVEKAEVAGARRHRSVY